MYRLKTKSKGKLECILKLIKFKYTIKFCGMPLNPIKVYIMINAYIRKVSNQWSSLSPSENKNK